MALQLRRGPPDDAHWVAIKGYEYPSDPYDQAVICTDSYTGQNGLFIDWDSIGEGPLATVEIFDS